MKNTRDLHFIIHSLKPVTLFSADQKTLSPMAEIFLLCGNVYLKRSGITSCPHSITYKTKFWPEPGVRAVKVGVHLEVVLKVFLHLCLRHKLTMLDNNHTLKITASILQKTNRINKEVLYQPGFCLGVPSCGPP